MRELYNVQPQMFVAGTDLYADGKVRELLWDSIHSQPMTVI